MPLTNVDPHIRVKNVGRSVEWYTRMLGFKVVTAIPDKKKPAFARLKLPDADWALMISDGSDPFTGKKTPKATQDAIASRKAQRVVSLYLWGDQDVRRLHRSLKRKGAKVVQEPTDQPYGMRELTVQDPDGYQVSVAQGIEAAQG